MITATAEAGPHTALAFCSERSVTSSLLFVAQFRSVTELSEPATEVGSPMKLDQRSGGSCEPFLRSVCFVAGSDKWTSLERKLFNKALATYSKDFIFVQKMVSMPFPVAHLKPSRGIVRVKTCRRILVTGFMLFQECLPPLPGEGWR